MTLKNNRAPLLSNIKLYASSHHHRWIQTGVTVRKRLSWVVTSVTLTFDLWPWHFAWTSLLSLVITPENFMMIGWWEHSQKGVTDRRTDGQTDRQTDRQTDWTIHRAAWSQLKMKMTHHGIDLISALWHLRSPLLSLNMAWKSNYIDNFLWEAITRPCTNFNSGLVKPSLKSVGQGWLSCRSDYLSMP